MAEAGSRTILVLGGARSGKSRFAEQLVGATGLKQHYLATGRAWDDEMKARIAAHILDRGEGWTTIEEPLELVDSLMALDDPENAILVDCLTLWLTNLMIDNRDVAEAGRHLVDHVRQAKAQIVFVSNEVGLGIVPENRMARDFRDQAGKLHQMLAASAQQVYFVAAGLPLKMKG